MASLSRLQNVTPDTQVFVSGAGQIAGKNLDSSEQMSLGGLEGIRAYPTNEGSGDNGFLARAELRNNIYDGVQLLGFYDAGWIQQHEDPWAGWNSGRPTEPNAYWLQGVGVGANWLPRTDTRVSAVVAHTLGSNAGHAANGDNADGRDESTRLFVSASFIF